MWSQLPRLIADSPITGSRLLVDEASELDAFATPFTIRISVGAHNQEDLVVTNSSALHGGADGRFALRLAAPTRRAHFAGELLRRVQLHALLRTRFEVEWDGQRLFDAHVEGPDVPQLDDERDAALAVSRLTAEGRTAVAEPAGRALAAARAAVRGWCLFAFAPEDVEAASVRIGLGPVSRGDVSLLSRGGSAGVGPLADGTGGQAVVHASRPLAAVLDQRRERGYWSNVSEARAGWVVKVPLGEMRRGVAGTRSWPIAWSGPGSQTDPREHPPPPVLSAREARQLGLGRVSSFGHGLYSRTTPNSEVGTPATELPGSHGQNEEDEFLLVQYERLQGSAT